MCIYVDVGFIDRILFFERLFSPLQQLGLGCQEDFHIGETV